MQGEDKQHRALSGQVSFLINKGVSPSQLINRYGLGSNETGILRLTAYEALYLFLKGKIKPENISLNSLPKLISTLGLDDDLEIFFVYRELKDKGLRLKVQGRKIFYKRKNGKAFLGPIVVIKESETLSDAEMA
ncbi:MAG: hypothetical protein QW812_04435, partial [Thermoplasmataceae archaeon]